MPDLTKSRAVVAAIALLLCSLVSVCPADKLYHVDGTVIEGAILLETEDEIKIDTKYGQLIYSKADLTKIERQAQQEGVATPPPSATPTPVNYATMVPVGPIDPFAPPVIPPIVQMIARGETPPPERHGPVQTTVLVPPTAGATPPAATPREVSAPDVGTAAKSLSDELNALKARIEAEKAGQQTPPTGLPLAGTPATAPAGAFKFQPPAGMTITQAVKADQYMLKDPTVLKTFGVAPLSMDVFLVNVGSGKGVVGVYLFADAATAQGAQAKAGQSASAGEGCFLMGNTVVTAGGDAALVTAVQQQVEAASKP